MSDRVRLRPVAEADLAELDRMFADPAAIGEFNWGGWTNPLVWRRRWEDNRLLADDTSVLMVQSATECVGFVSWRSPGGGPPGLRWEVGMSLWPQARGHGYGTEVLRQLVRYLFAHTQANRIQATTEVDNRAAQRILEKAGFTREGVLRGYGFRAGAWRDELLYSVLRAEVPLD
jgi:RimJ/RimL family protein N-acetyltransferase